MDERKEETVELVADNLEDVNGGCWFWGMFGTHRGMNMESFSLRADDGTVHEYGKFQCEDCGGIFYTVKNMTTGVKEAITEAEYNRASSFWDHL